jgi:Ran GTPase-activating protein (RanGAP) involved in mRNA processing and transport
MLASNTSLKELDLSGYGPNNSASSDAEFAKAFAVGLSANGALVKLDVSDNRLRAAGGKVLAEALAGNQVLKELNIASNKLSFGVEMGSTDMSGIIAISDAIPTMGALTSLNMSCNKMASEEVGKALGDAIASNSTLTELDISNSCDTAGWAAGHGSNNGPGFAKGITDGLRANGALTSLNISGNRINRNRVDGQAIVSACASKGVALRMD